jgi:hypothetical protein
MSWLNTNCDLLTIPVQETGPKNLNDIRRYVATRADAIGIEEYRRRHGLTVDRFVEHITEKSGGNFLYVRQVLLDIEQGRMTDHALASIPTDLGPYYALQLTRMKGAGGVEWHEVQLPVVAALCLAQRPLTAAQIALLTGVPPTRVSWALDRAGQFLNSSYVTVAGRTRPAYSIYHETYQEFLLQETKQVAADLLDRVIDVLLSRPDLMGEP